MEILIAAGQITADPTYGSTAWPGRFGPIPWVYGDIIKKLTRGERVELLVNDRVVATATEMPFRFRIPVPEGEHRVRARAGVRDGSGRRLNTLER